MFFCGHRYQISGNNKTVEDLKKNLQEMSPLQDLFLVYVYGYFVCICLSSPGLFILTLSFWVWEHLTEELLCGRQDASSETGIQEETIATWQNILPGLYVVPVFCLPSPPSNDIFLRLHQGLIIHNIRVSGVASLSFALSILNPIWLTITVNYHVDLNVIHCFPVWSFLSMQKGSQDVTVYVLKG